MLEQNSLKVLQSKKNLLAFSGGVDSTALFFLLQDQKIVFDIAIVNYNLRKKAKEEVLYAKELAKKYKLKCFVLDSTPDIKNLEANARQIRYNFFETIIKENSYNNLLTAHHLGDRFEWMMMQFCKGAGSVELLSMDFVEMKNSYTLVRPLLHLDKSELLLYLEKNKIKYFIDESNNDESIKRNYFRHQICKPLLDKNLAGIKKSFEYIAEDKKLLIQPSKVESIQDFYYFKTTNERSDIYVIDKLLKSLRHIITSQERILLQNARVNVLGRKYLIVKHDIFIFISPYINHKIIIDKKQKEIFRKLKIEPKLRAYLYNNKDVFNKVKELHSMINAYCK
jgi:tRNA(Ile)-lysidine synthase